MDLFIETPERAAERLERERRLQEAWMASLQQGEAGARRMQHDGVPEVRSASEAGRHAAEAGYSASAEREQQREGERRPGGERKQEERRPSGERPRKARGFGRRRRMMRAPRRDPILWRRRRIARSLPTISAAPEDESYLPWCAQYAC